jgi:hypothetical protein
MDVKSSIANFMHNYVLSFMHEVILRFYLTFFF